MRKMDPIINLKDVTVSYKENVALESLSLKIHERDFVGIGGPNGAGKTTLLTAINGLGRLLKGSVKVFGIEMNARSATKIRKEIGYVPQIINIDPRLPMMVKEVISMGRYGKIGLFKRPTSRDKKIVSEVVDLIGIGNLLKKPIGHLSGGEQKKVTIARALAQRPRILLLDEPISNLDINAQQNIMELMDKIHEEKQLTIIVVMHYLNLLPGKCSRMVLLKNARLIFDGDIQEALSEQMLSRLYECSIKRSRRW